METFIIIILAIIYAVSDGPSRNFAIPLSISVTSGSINQVATFNTLYSYPIQLDGVDCYPSTLSLCLSDPANNIENSCCISLNDKSSYPYEIVSSGLNLVMSLLVMTIVLILRSFVWKFSWNILSGVGPDPPSKVRLLMSIHLLILISLHCNCCVVL